MKLIKGIVLFSFLGLVISSCFNEPEFSDNPEVKFVDIYFGQSNDPGIQDSLVLTFDFKDGNGDIGIANAVDSPFHYKNFFVENTPELIPVTSYVVNGYGGLKFGSNNAMPKLDHYYLDYIPKGKKLVTYNSRANGFPNLPPKVVPYTTCESIEHYFSGDTVIIPAIYKTAVDKSKIVDSLLSTSGNITYYYCVLDDFYANENPYYNNVSIKIFQKINGNFEEFDIREQYCLSFDGRITVELVNGKKPLEGTISYVMKSFGLINIFSVKTLYIEFSLTDRALNKSKPAETIRFTLSDIKR